MLQGSMGKDPYGQVKQDSNIMVAAPENGHSKQVSSKQKEEEFKQNEIREPAYGNNSKDIVAN